MIRAIFIVIVSVILLTSFGLAQEAKRLVYALANDVAGIDPHIHASPESGMILRNIYDTLVYRDPQTKEFVPGLASSWSISEDGQVYTFQLRRDVLFHDGVLFNAQAVAANIDRILSESTASQRARAMLGPFARYEIVDDFTIRLELVQAFSPLLDSLSQPYLGIASPAAIAEFEDDIERYQFHQVGSGPFIFIEFLPGDRVVLQRNPEYRWGPEFLQTSVPDPIREVEFRFYLDTETQLAALQNGEAQALGALSPESALNFANLSRIQLHPVVIPGQPVQFLINTKNSPTDELAVRQALLFAANRNVIVDTVTNGQTSIAWGPLSPGTLHYDPRVAGAYAYDVAQAQSLLSSAGYEDRDGDGFLDRDGVDLNLTILIPSGDLILDVAAVIQEQWASIGIKTDIKVIPIFSRFLEAVNAGNYNLVFAQTSGLDPGLLNSWFLSVGLRNWSGYSDPELDAALTQATLLNNPQIRAEAYARAQAIIMNQALILPVFERVVITVHQTTVEGLQFDAYGWYPIFSNVTIP